MAVYACVCTHKYVCVCAGVPACSMECKESHSNRKHNSTKSLNSKLFKVEKNVKLDKKLRIFRQRSNNSSLKV